MNRIELVGRLARDPEVRFTSGANPVACTKLVVACDRGKKKDGEAAGADFIPVTVWGKPGEACEKYLKKGSQVAVAGVLRIGSYEYKGEKRTSSDVVAEKVEFLSGTKPQPETGEQLAMPGMAGDVPSGFDPADDIPF